MVKLTELIDDFIVVETSEKLIKERFLKKKTKFLGIATFLFCLLMVLCGVGASLTNNTVSNITNSTGVLPSDLNSTTNTTVNGAAAHTILSVVTTLPTPLISTTTTQPVNTVPTKIVPNGTIGGQNVTYSYPVTGKSPSKSLVMIVQNNEAPPSPIGSPNTIVVGGANLTPSERKLSSALLQMTRWSSNVSVQNQPVSEEGLETKTVPSHVTSAASNSATENISSGELVYIYVSFEPGYSTHMVDSLVADVTDRDENNHLIAAWVDAKNLLPIADLEGVQNIQEVTPPTVNLYPLDIEGDTILKTATVRAQYGGGGAGMKIGVISNGVNSIAQSESAGDLPSNVIVLSNTVGGDEGTAMLEIVHAMAPNAQLYFHDCGSNTVAFIAGVNQLKADGCTVIVDDISWNTEPFFQDGYVASNVEAITPNVVYISSADNYAQQHFQGTFCPGEYVTYPPSTTKYYLNDDTQPTSCNPTLGYSHHEPLYVFMPWGSSIYSVLEWNDPFSSANNLYNIVLVDNSDMDAFYLSTPPGKGGTSQTILAYTASSSTCNEDYSIGGVSGCLVDVDVSEDPGNSGYSTIGLYIFPSGGAGVLTPSQLTGTGLTANLVPAGSIHGQPAAPDVIAAAALPESNPTVNEPFSSEGPVTITYPSATTRTKPDISGVDGVQTSGAGGFSEPFYGTSAAAPSIAAVVADVWGLYPSTSAAQIRAYLKNSADYLGSADIFGSGRADAMNMVNNMGPPIKATDKIGASNGEYWYLDTNGLGYWTAGDQYDNFGVVGWTPVVGNWNGNSQGKDEIGASNGEYWYLDVNGNGYWTAGDQYDNFGVVGWTPVVGDWNGQGKTEIGASNGEYWYLDTNGLGYWTAGDQYDNFGVVGWKPIVGDWS
jgi:hypothetical protein